MLRDLGSHLRAAVRALVLRPAYAALTILTLALAIAANATVFSLVSGALLRPLPFAEAERLVALDVIARTGFSISASIPNFRDFRDRARSFDAYAGSAGWNLRLLGDGDPEVLQARAVLGDFFGMLGLVPALGRGISADEAPDREGGANVAVVSHGLWQQRYGADPALVGRTITLSGRPYTVVGVLPRGVGYPSPDIQVYVPMATIPSLPWEDRDSGFGTVALARLAPGVTLAAAQEDLARVGRDLRRELGPTADVPEVDPLSDRILGDVGAKLWILFGAVGLVLLIAVANLGNLVLARHEARHRELAVRAAIGALPGRLFALVAVECLVIALAGGVLGAAASWIALEALAPFLADALPAVVLDQVRVDWRVVGFGVVLAVATGLAFAALPGLRAARLPVTDALRTGTRSVAAGGRLRGALVVSEIALALMLLMGAGLMLESLAKLDAVDKGYDPRNVLAAGVASSSTRVDTLEKWEGYHETLLEQASALPGVERAAFALLVPLSGNSWERGVHPEGVPVTDETADSMLYNIVSPDYFATLGIALVRGRAFGPDDRTGTAPVVVIDETMAARYWPGADPIGKRVTFDQDADGQPIYRTVVGVARNVRHYEVGAPSRIQAYVPLAQSGRPSGTTMRLLLRAGADPAALIAPLRALVKAHDPEAPVFAIETLDAFVDQQLARSRAMAAVLGGFAAAALALAALGIFGVMSYAVLQRRREIGIRMALGADRARIARVIGSQAVRLTLAGLVLGVVGSFALTRMLGAALYEVDPLDPGVLLRVAALLAVAALGAAMLPTWRATRARPAEVLADEG